MIELNRSVHTIDDLQLQNDERLSTEFYNPIAQNWGR